MTFNPTLDRQAALDGDLSARMRQEVLIPFNKILKDCLHQREALDPEGRQKHVNTFNDEVVNMMASSIILWMHAQGVKEPLFKAILPLLLDQIYRQTLKLEGKAK